jgi:hypothetical protein
MVFSIIIAFSAFPLLPRSLRSLHGIEAQLAPHKSSYPHSIHFPYDCYTQLGAKFIVKRCERLMPGRRRWSLPPA